MKTIFWCTFFAYWSLGATAFAQLSDAKQEQFAALYRKAMHLDSTCEKIKSGDIDPKRLAIIHAVLSATQEVFIHQQRGASKNKIYVSPDGHKEAVFGPDGKLVADGMNDGTYNYFHPQSDAMRHFLYDIHPWIIWGVARKDPTSLNERIFSYVSDLERGITAASKLSAIRSIDPTLLRVGELEAYAIFMCVIRKGEVEELFSLIESDRLPDSAGLVPILRKLESGFRNVYAQPAEQGALP